jgi:hypothetical protein
MVAAQTCRAQFLGQGRADGTTVGGGGLIEPVIDWCRCTSSRTQLGTGSSAGPGVLQLAYMRWVPGPSDQEV